MAEGNTEGYNQKLVKSPKQNPILFSRENYDPLQNRFKKRTRTLYPQISTFKISFLRKPKMKRS